MKIKKIPLTRGFFAIVDEEDYATVSKHKWRCLASGYATRNQVINGKKTFFYMHRLIMNAKQGEFVDHINFDKLDNRRLNLRICTKLQNNRYRKLRSNNTSGYKGVWKASNRNMWYACIRIKGKPMSLGYHKKKEDAARAYDEAAMKYFGEFALLNYEK